MKERMVFALMVSKLLLPVDYLLFDTLLMEV
jgi:hypothetical protein